MTEFPIGCDAFGYQRQAKLFSDNGVAGLDTRLTFPVADQMIAAMQEASLPPAHWREAVAPHCHHYKPEVQRIVLQYPPGTGFLMSLTSEGFRFRTVLAASFAVLTMVLLLAVGAQRSWLLWAFSLAAAFLVFDELEHDLASYSVAPSLAVASVAGLVTSVSLNLRKWWLFAALGLLIGLSASIRLPNAFFIVGPGALLLIRFLRFRDITDLLLGVSLGFGMMAGLVPLLAANGINSGSVLSTTYSGADTSLMFSAGHQIDVFKTLFFEGSRAARLATFAFVAGIFVLLVKPTQGAVAGMISFGSLVVFLLTKSIVNSYYLAPLSVFLLFSLASSSIRPGRLLRGLPVAMLAVFALVGFLGLRGFTSHSSLVDGAVKSRLDRNSVVWSHLLSGYFVLFDGVYSAKLAFARPDVQIKLVGAMSERNIKQFFADDGTKPMAEILDRFRPHLTLLGKAHGHDIYEYSVDSR